MDILVISEIEDELVIYDVEDKLVMNVYGVF